MSRPRKMLGACRSGLTLCVIAVMLGCALRQDGVQPPTAVPAKHTEPGGSWMATGTRRKDLLYVSAGREVVVYEYGTGVVLGKLVDFNGARGSCSDQKGDVFVTNYDAADIVEFAHGGTKPIRFLIDPSPYPVDCSVDPTTGNLAVVNLYGKTEYSQGNVAIYAGAKGKPKRYVFGFTGLTGCAYDGHGNLLVSYYPRDVVFAYMPAGSNKFAAMSLPLSYNWYGPPYVRWDGEYFVVGLRDEFDGLIFVQYTISGSSGTEEGSVPVSLGGGDSGPFWVGRINGAPKQHLANSVVAAVPDDGTYFWGYPSGELIFELIDDVDTYGTGVTASLGQK